ncbi:MAG: transglutaminase [Gammaproteobacteria bacterium]|nr:MAG: transglutaminase [Gammaproteobacteria bacterium]
MLTNARFSTPSMNNRLSTVQFQHPDQGRGKQRTMAQRVLLVSSLILIPLFTCSALVDNSMLTDLKSKYGKRAQKRGVELQKLLAELKNADTKTKLKKVNDHFNKFTYRSDKEFWGEKDYWATPIEFIGRAGGDCEDYVISKYFALRSLGIPDKKLFLTYAKATKQKIPHMVLNYFETPKSMPLVLDNYDKRLLPANKTVNLKPIYSFNADSLFLANPSAGLGKSLPTDKIKNSKWDKLLSDVRSKKS